MDKKYRFIVNEILENGEEVERSNEIVRNINALAECYDDENHMMELVMNDNLVGIAAKIAGSKKFRPASKLASVMLDMDTERMAELEDTLSGLIEGGIQ